MTTYRWQVRQPLIDQLVATLIGCTDITDTRLVERLTDMSRSGSWLAGEAKAAIHRTTDSQLSALRTAVAARLKHPTCYLHADRRARHPRTMPVFCTVRCAADYGIQYAEGMEFCFEHREWHRGTDDVQKPRSGCSLCATNAE